MVKSKWFPTQKRVVVSPSFVMISKDAIQPKTVKFDDKCGSIVCYHCLQELGRVDKRFANICSLHTSATKFHIGNPKESFLYFDRRFRNDDRFFAWLLLSQCEGQSSLKLVIRSYDKRPYLLIWLLESYVIFTKGAIDHDSKNPQKQQSKISTPFPALKMLYKVFNESTAVSDPRANGEDASVGLVDVPLSCILRMMELLLERSNFLPPSVRSVGQFYVGYLKLDDGFEVETVEAN